MFEYVYFSRPDSRIFGHSVDKVRRKLGKALAEEHPVYPHVEGERIRTIPVPDRTMTPRDRDVYVHEITRASRFCADIRAGAGPACRLDQLHQRLCSEL